MLKQLSLALFLAFTMCACSNAHKQTTATSPKPSPTPSEEMASPATAGGFIKDKSDKRVANALVTIRYVDNNGINMDTKAVKSTSDGTFFVENIPVRYGDFVSIVVTADGYKSKTVENYRLGMAPPIIRLDKIKAKK